MKSTPESPHSWKLKCRSHFATKREYDITLWGDYFVQLRNMNITHAFNDCFTFLQVVNALELLGSDNPSKLEIDKFQSYTSSTIELLFKVGLSYPLFIRSLCSHCIFLYVTQNSSFNFGQSPVARDGLRSAHAQNASKLSFFLTLRYLIVFVLFYFYILRDLIYIFFAVIPWSWQNQRWKRNGSNCERMCQRTVRHLK